MKEKARINMNIRVGSVVNSEVGDMEKKAREGRIRSTRKDVVGCVQDVIGKKKILVQFKGAHEIYISTSLMLHLFKKEEVGQEVYETI